MHNRSAVIPSSLPVGRPGRGEPRRPRRSPRPWSRHLLWLHLGKRRAERFRTSGRPISEGSREQGATFRASRCPARAALRDPVAGYRHPTFVASLDSGPHSAALRGTLLGRRLCGSARCRPRRSPPRTARDRAVEESETMPEPGPVRSDRRADVGGKANEVGRGRLRCRGLRGPDSVKAGIQHLAQLPPARGFVRPASDLSGLPDAALLARVGAAGLGPRPGRGPLAHLLAEAAPE